MNSRFEKMAIYDHLFNFLKRQGDTLPNAVQLEQEKLILIESLKKLAFQISIPTSQLDDVIVLEISKALGKVPIISSSRLKLDISDCSPDTQNRLYDLTVYGEIEAKLRGNIVDSLRAHLTNIENYVDNEEAAHDHYYHNAWDEYALRMDDFKEGDDGYDYEGAISPEEPSIQPFNRKSAIARRKAELRALNLDDGRVVLQKVTLQTGLIVDMLNEEFEACEFIDDIVANLNFENLNVDAITRIFRTKDFYFPDCDLFSEGFLLTMLVDNVEQDFDDERVSADHHHIVVTVLTAMSKQPKLDAMMNNYEHAVKENDNLALQRYWFFLNRFVTFVSAEMTKKNFNVNLLPSKLEKMRSSFKGEHKTQLGALIKVFPTDDTDHLFYPGIHDPFLTHDGQDNLPYYPTMDAKLPLNPYFHTLEVIARKSHEVLVAIAGENSKTSKTNVVTAMMSFVVSMEPDIALIHSKTPCQRKFITIPINFDYKSLLLSFDREDEVFKDEDDIESSIGFNLQRGYEMTGRDYTLSADDAKNAKGKLLRMVRTLNLPNQDEILATLTAAEIAEPVNLGYQIASDIAKSTEHRHSERVIARALKVPANLEKIVNSLRQHLAELVGLKQGTYTIHSGALLLYSYPNSICDPCSISLVSLQGSYNEGFLKYLIEEINKSTDNTIRLRTRGFNTATRQQVEDEFGVTIIASSKDVFAKDLFAQLVDHRPEAKYTCQQMPFFGSTPGINLRYKNGAMGNNRFYEYTAGSKLHIATDTTVAIPYQGNVFMSGTKHNKFGKKNTVKLEEAVKQIANQPQEMGM
jgi:hypothetical protein